MQKYNKGDKVRINRNAPLWVREHVKYSRTRTIEGSFYDTKQQHRLYQLHGDVPYSFRASQLEPVSVEQLTKRGRPSVRKRAYSRKNTATPLKSKNSPINALIGGNIPPNPRFSSQGVRG